MLEQIIEEIIDGVVQFIRAKIMPIQMFLVLVIIVTAIDPSRYFKPVPLICRGIISAFKDDE